MASASYDVFLSHSSADVADAESLAKRLRAAHLRPFLDTWQLTPGRPWQEALEDALLHSEVVAVLIGAGGIGPWHNEEMRAALNRAARSRDDHRVIPVLLPGADAGDLPLFLSRRTAVSFGDGLDDGRAFAALVAGIRGEAPNQPTAVLPDEPTPYPSLKPFTQRDASFYFGRDSETANLLERVQQSSFVAVVGASGSGKSSLVQAGLLPKVSRSWRVLTLSPGPRPLRALADAVATLGPPHDRLDIADRLALRFKERPDGLSTALTSLDPNPGVGRTTLVLVDQFEELFSQVTGQPATVRPLQAAFIRNLDDAVRSADGRFKLLITLRADFWQQCLEFAELRALLEPNQFLLGPMGADDLREAIVKPAQAIGALFEHGLVSRLIGDMHDHPSALPLLQAALAELWRRRRGLWLTHDDYDTIGGISGALDRRADEIYGNLTESQRVLARLLFLRLVNLGEGVGDTRRRARRDELRFVGVTRVEVDTIIAILSRPDVRLVSADRETIELVHDALIERWGLLASWLQTNRDDLRFHRQLTDVVQEWDQHGREAGYLYRGKRLEAALDYAARNPHDLSPPEPEFLADSQRYEQEQLEAQNEARAAQERLRAERPLARAGEALFELEHSPERALLLVLSAGLEDVARSSVVRRTAYRALDTVKIRRILHGHGDRISSVAWHPRVADTVATGSYDQTVRLWSAGTGRLIAILKGHTGPVTCLAWSPDGTRLLTGSWDQTARIWDPNGQSVVRVLEGHDSWVSSVTWSPSGLLAATGSQDNTARLWDVATGATIQVLQGHTAWVRSAEWRPDEQEVLTGSYDRTAAVWDVASGNRIATLEGHEDAVPAVAWSADGSQALTASEDGTIRLWDMEAKETIRVIRVHTSPVYAVAWAPGGRRALTGGEDGGVRVWDLDSGELAGIYPGHTGWVSSVAWRPDGQQVISGSEDATARVCDVRSGLEPRVLGRHEAWASSVAWRPDGSLLASAGGDGVVRLWSPAGDGQLAALPEASMGTVAWSPDGRRVAVGSFAGSVQVWDVELMSLVADLAGHTDQVTVVAWRPDGRRLLSGSHDRSVRLWDVERQTTTTILRHDQWITDAAWSPDGDRVLLATWDQDGYVWEGPESARAAVLKPLTGHTAALHAAAWSQNGSRLLTSSGDGTARVWDARTYEEVRKLRAGEANAATWSPDSQHVVTGSRDGALRVWDVESGLEVLVLRHPSSVFSAAWDPAGTRLGSASEDGIVRLWSIDDGSVVSELTRRVCDLFSDEEIRREIPDWLGRPVADGQETRTASSSS